MNPEPLPEKKWLNTKEVAAIFGVSRNTIYYHIKRGAFPDGRKAPGGRLWSREVIEKWLAAGQATDKVIKALAK